MSTDVFFIVQPFAATEAGRCYPLPPTKEATKGGCLRLARSLARQHGGAVAIMQRVNCQFSQFDASVVLAEYGNVPSGGFGSFA